MIDKKALSQKPDIRLAALNDFVLDNTAKNYRLRITSGTSGGEPLLFAIRRGFEASKKEKALLSDLHAVVLCFGNVNIRASLVGHFLFFYDDNNRRVLSVTESDLSDNLERIMTEFSPDGFYGNPSFIAQILLKIENREILDKIKCVRFTGERVGQNQLEVFKNKIPRARIENFYAMAEAGYISAVPCGFLEINKFHPGKGIGFKIIDADSEKIGEIVLSTDFSPSARFENYATGDVGRFIDKKCPCGNPITFEVFGRKNFDFIKLLGAVLRQEIFEEEIMRFEFVNDFRVLAEEVYEQNKILGKITIQIELNEDKKEKKSSRKKLLEKELPKNIFLTPTRTMAKLVKSGIFLPLNVQIVESFPPLTKKVKMKKIN